MKKTVNINIGGYPFIINDDAYDVLNRYLNSVNRHFQNSASYEEITGDIEGRLAELFLEKLGTRQILELRDIEAAIEIMGKPEDFGGTDESGSTTATGGNTYRTGKRLFRDPEDKVFGGVCSGIAAYFGIADPLWVRLFFFVLVFVFGISALFYFVLWIAMPKAVTSSDRLAMRGEPVNVSNIAKIVEEEVQNISDSFREKKNNAGPQEAAKAQTNRISEIIGNALKFFAEILQRIIEAIGLIIRPIVGFFGIIGIIILAAVWIVLITTFVHGYPIVNNFIAEQKMLAYLATFNIFFIAASVIGILTILLLRMLFRFKFNRRWYAVLAGFFFLNCLSLTIAAVGLAKEFSTHSSVKSEVFNSIIPFDTLNLQLNHSKMSNSSNWDFRLDGTNFHYNGVTLRVKKAEGEEFRLVKEVYAFGKNVENAENNAAQLNYNAVLEGNTLRLDESVDISGGLFRGQTVELVLYIPENKFLKTDSYAVENMLSFLEEGDNACELDREGTEIYRMEKNGQMECMSNRYRGGKSKLLNNYNFKTLKISDLDDIEVKKGTTFSVKLEGREESISETEVVQNGQTLVIRGNSKEGDSRHKSKYGKVRLVVMMPELELLDVEGRGKLEIRGFNQPEMAINLFGNQAADLLIDVENLKLDIEQAEVHLQGKGRKMDARVLYGVLKARQYTLKDVDITLKNGAEAQIYATGMVTQKGDFDRLEISGGAEIRSKKEL